MINEINSENIDNDDLEALLEEVRIDDAELEALLEEVRKDNYEY